MYISELIFHKKQWYVWYVDKFLAVKGHSVIRCITKIKSSVELLWAEVKNRVASYINIFNLKAVMVCTNQISEIDKGNVIIPRILNYWSDDSCDCTKSGEWSNDDNDVSGFEKMDCHSWLGQDFHLHEMLKLVTELDSLGINNSLGRMFISSQFKLS